mgnify:CR=1 FL=1
MAYLSFVIFHVFRGDLLLFPSLFRESPFIFIGRNKTLFAVSDKVGPAGNFSGFSNLSKLVLSFDMLAGRLELYPLLLTFAPSTWAKK